MTQDAQRRTNKIISGESWNEVCDRLKDAGNIVLQGPEDELTRAEGFRYLSRIFRAALQTFVEHGDPRTPVLQRVVHETAKMGADNPDNVYLNATVSGAMRYLISGTRGTARFLAGEKREQFLSFATQVGHYGRGNGMPPTGQLDSSALSVREDGTFDIHVSVDKPASLADSPRGQNWLPMSPETGTLIVRQSRLQASEVIAQLTITRVDADKTPAILTAAHLDEAFEQSGMLVGGAAMLFASWAQMFQAHTNQLPRFDQEMSNRFGGLKEIAYYHSYWRLAEDEALLVEVSPPECDHWNFQLNNHWMESLDYRFHRIHVNSASSVRKKGETIRVVVAHRDPQLTNIDWLETVGHTFGTMCFRWVRPEGEPPVPNARVVKFADLAAEIASI